MLPLPVWALPPHSGAESPACMSLVQMGSGSLYQALHLQECSLHPAQISYPILDSRKNTRPGDTAQALCVPMWLWESHVSQSPISHLLAHCSLQVFHGFSSVSAPPANRIPLHVQEDKLPQQSEVLNDWLSPVLFSLLVTETFSQVLGAILYFKSLYFLLPSSLLST